MENTLLKKQRNIWTQKEYLLEFDMLSTLENLFNLARERKKSPVDGSYTNKLLSDKSLSKEKVLEEINELIEAVDNNSNKIHEAADVLYHLIMYLEGNDVKIEDVMEELNKRKK
jgi:phosphoribosyl-ATP pyrophosphohydrolase